MLLRNELSAASVAEAAGGVALVLCAVVACLDLAASTCTATHNPQAALMHYHIDCGPAVYQQQETGYTCQADFAGKAFAQGRVYWRRKRIMTATAEWRSLILRLIGIQSHQSDAGLTCKSDRVVNHLRLQCLFCVQ